MAVTKLYLIRHAEAEGNLYRRIHGWYDSLITENGYRQIAALEERFRNIPVDAVYSSDLFRTRTTASAIYKPKGLKLNTCRALREINMGVWEDRTWAETAQTDPEQLGYFNSNAPAFHCEGSETFEQLRQRVGSAVLKIAAAHPGKTVAVFSHGMAIRNTVGLFLGYSAAETNEKVPHGDNTSVTLLEVEDGKVRVAFYGDNSHLPEEISTLARQSWWKSREGSLADANLWFRPLDMEHDSQFYYQAREEAWVTIHGSMLYFDGEGFLRDAKDQARYDQRSVMQVMLGDKPAGVLQLNLRRDADKGVGSIPFFYMLPECRKRGLGVQLLGQAVSTYRPLGRKYLRLRCAPDNYVAQRFYQRYGFKKIGEDPGSRVPLDIMEKYIGYDR
ncbi:MAG: GNAT family N-acetyltransferase [Oscillospiraceae bacterium]